MAWRLSKGVYEFRECGMMGKIPLAYVMLASKYLASKRMWAHFFKGIIKELCADFVTEIFRPINKRLSGHVLAEQDTIEIGYALKEALSVLRRRGQSRHTKNTEMRSTNGSLLRQYRTPELTPIRSLPPTTALIKTGVGKKYDHPFRHATDRST